MSAILLYSPAILRFLFFASDAFIPVLSVVLTYTGDHEPFWKSPNFYTKKMLNMHVYNFKKPVPQIIICTPPLKIFTITHGIERFLFFSVCFVCFCLYIMCLWSQKERSDPLEPGLRAVASYHLNPSHLQEQMLLMPSNLSSLLHFTNWHSHLCFSMVNLLCLQDPLSWIMAPVLHFVSF